MAVALVVGSCARSSGPKLGERVIPLGQPVPKGGGVYKVGNAYQVKNRWYHPREDTNYDRVGMASWYGELFHGRRTSNGEIYDMTALTAAHPTLPMPTYARVTNLSNDRTIVVRVNDRGPFANDRIIDLSRRSAELLNFTRQGTARVRVTYLGRAPLNGDDRYERRVLAGQPWARGLASVADEPRRKYAQATDAMLIGSLADRPAQRNAAADKARIGARDSTPGTAPMPDSVFVQAGTFRNLDNAERLRSELADLGPVAVDRVERDDTVFHRVRLGPFADRQSARQALKRAVAAGAAGAQLRPN